MIRIISQGHYGAQILYITVFLSLMSFYNTHKIKIEHLIYETLNSIQSDNRTSDYTEIICINYKLIFWKVYPRFYIVMVIQF